MLKVNHTIVICSGLRLMALLAAGLFEPKCCLFSRRVPPSFLFASAISFKERDIKTNMTSKMQKKCHNGTFEGIHCMADHVSSM